jgi:uncharacterized protein (TIGR03067 family)
MHRTTLAALAALALLALPLAADDKDDVVKKEMKALEGNWELVSAVQDGDVATLPKDGSLQAIIKGDHITFQAGKTVVLTAAFTLDPAATPKALNLVPSDGDQKGKSMPAIYELKGDEFKLCRADPGKDRPTDFTAKAGSGRFLAVYKRVKK